jgi:hypothetical protein
VKFLCGSASAGSRPPGSLKKLAAALCLGSALLPLPAQIDTDLHGSVETFHALPFSQGLGLTDSRTAFAGEVSVYAGPVSAFVSLSAEHNGASPDRTGVSLGEAWAEWGVRGFSLRLGRQLLSWGAADGLVLTDVVCPQNLAAYAGLDFAGSRLPVDGLRLRHTFSSFAADAVWLPLFTPARLPGDSRNPLRGIFYPAAVDGTSVHIVEPALPQAISDGEYGLRVSAYAPALDFSVMVFYGWNDIPWKSTAPPSASSAVLEARPGYGRTLTAGSDASLPLGDFLLRLEAAWTGGGRYDRPSEETAAALAAGQTVEPVEKQSLKALAGLDWAPSGWTLSVQYYENLLPDAYQGGTARPWRKSGVSLRAARGFFRETLNLSAWCYLDLQDFDTASGASAAYALTDNLELSLGCDLFNGGIDGRGDYGSYEDLSCLWIRGIFRF